MHTKILVPSHSGALAVWTRAAIRPLAGLAQRLGESLRRKRDYQRLSSLDDHLLKDIGIDRADIHNIMEGRGPKGPARDKWVAVEPPRPKVMI